MYSPVEFANFVHFCISITYSGKLFPCLIKKYTEFANLPDYIFHILKYFAAKLSNCANNFSQFKSLSKYENG